MLQEENSQHRLSLANIYIQKKTTFIFHMGEEFMSLVLTFLAQFKFIFLAMIQIHWVLPRNVSKKKIFEFFNIIRVYWIFLSTTVKLTRVS